MKKLLSIIFLAIAIISFACDTTEPPDNPPPVVVPTTEAEGPGGNAYMYGFIKDYVHPSKTVSNTHIYIMNHENYNDTILHIFVNSTDASFKITELPEEKVDLIFMNNNYLCAKIGKLSLQANENSFYNPHSSGYFIDSAIYITSIADSVSRPDAPEFGLQGYGVSFTVAFKAETADSIAWEIVRSSGCDTLRVFRYDDPVFDPFENDVYNLKLTNIDSIQVKLEYFNWLKEAKEASPNFLVIQQ